MELKDIKELMKILKNEDIAEMKVRYGKVKLTLVKSKEEKIILEKNVEKIPSKKEEKLEKIVKSKNVGEIKLEKIEKGMEVFEGMVLAKINTIGIETDVKSPVNGILKDVLVLDQSMVDYGKQLFILEVK